MLMYKGIDHKFALPPVTNGYEPCFFIRCRVPGSLLIYRFLSLSTKDYSNNTTTLYTTRRNASISDSGAIRIKTTTGSLLPNKLINTKKVVLDDSSNSLKIIIVAVKT